MHRKPSSASSSPDRVPARLESEYGNTLIEVLVAALIVALVSAATATALIGSAHASGDQRLRSQADALATQDQERLRSLSDEQLGTLNGSSDQTRTVHVDVNGQNVPFTVSSTAVYANSQGNSSCTSNAATFYKVTSTVSWQESFNGQAPSVSEDSLISRPVTGQLLTTAQDQTGSPLSGVTVAVSPSGQQGVTDANGCVLLAGLSSGAYKVTVSRQGYVDLNGNATLNGSATLADTDTSAVATTGNPFTLGQAGAVDATFSATAAGGATVPGEADGVQWMGTGPSGSMAQAGMYPATAPAVPLTEVTTPTDLFPFDTALPGATPSYADNYTVWGGRCAGQQPPGEKPAFSVGPGVTASTPTVQEPFLDVTSFSATVNGVVQTVPTDIVLTYSANGCTDRWSAAVAAANPNGSAPSNGWLKYPGQPYAASGALTVCADYKTSQGVYYSGSTVVGNSSLTAENPVPSITATQGAACST